MSLYADDVRDSNITEPRADCFCAHYNTIYSCRSDESDPSKHPAHSLVHTHPLGSRQPPKRLKSWYVRFPICDGNTNRTECLPTPSRGVVMFVITSSYVSWSHCGIREKCKSSSLSMLLSFSVARLLLLVVSSALVRFPNLEGFSAIILQ